MKSSHRPPLNLTDPEPGEGPDESAPIVGADDERLNETPVEFEAELSLPPAP